nr:MAG TPA: hypothetical protein [Bacteriophage sp.]
MILAAQLNFYVVEFCRLQNLKFKTTQILSRLVQNFKILRPLYLQVTRVANKYRLNFKFQAGSRLRS